MTKLCAGLVALLTGAALFVLYVGHLGSGRSPVLVEIPSGLTAVETGEVLQEKGLIASSFLFHIAAKFTGYDRKLKPGKYLMVPGTPILKSLRILKAGSNTEVKVSIPEGFSVRQIAERLEAAGVCKAAAFEKYAQENRLEGYLFPATYQFEPQSLPEKAASRMRVEFKRQVEPAYEAAKDRPQLTLQQTVTLASIVQREAVLSVERPIIAAVYLNRMRKRMMLEADPTVQYALGRWKKGLTLTDLKDSSPYNTYTHYGLPPGPICSPGLESILGVLHPAKTSALFFVADMKGGHNFTNTIEEHLKAKGEFKRGLRAQKEKLRREGAAKRD